MAMGEKSNWMRATIVITVAVISSSTALSVYIFRKKSKVVNEKMRELQKSLKVSEKKCAAERQGRTRAQQAVRKALTHDNSNKSKQSSYPMTPIAVVQSCFSTSGSGSITVALARRHHHRYGTPRQPLLVPLARACLVFDTSRVPPAALEGLTEYSHCWIIYVFHLNTDLEKLWKQPHRSKIKAKVRVPKLKGGRMGVFGTRSPHRPCPIGLTVAKVEAVQGNMVLLSGVDLVDGTPVLDIKPYLPYCDSIQGAKVPDWVTADDLLAVASVNFSHEFSSTLGNCWVKAEDKSLYASPDELKGLIGQILYWDIRSLSQRIQPHNIVLKADYLIEGQHVSDSEDDKSAYVPIIGSEEGPATAVTYHLMIEGLDVSYTIDGDDSVVVGKVTLFPMFRNGNQHRCNYMTWRDVIG